MTFKEAHYTEFFENKNRVFKPFMAHVHSRYFEFQAMEMKIPLWATLEPAEQKMKQQRYIDGIKAINALEEIDSCRRRHEAHDTFLPVSRDGY